MAVSEPRHQAVEVTVTAEELARPVALEKFFTPTIERCKRFIEMTEAEWQDWLRKIKP
jgi:hypothetical protein